MSAEVLHTWIVILQRDSERTWMQLQMRKGIEDEHFLHSKK